MKHLQISEQKAKELYPTASTEFKTMLEETFGKDFFKVSIMDRVKTWGDAWEMVRCTPEYDCLAGWGYLTKRERAFRSLCIITEVLNEGEEGKFSPSFNKQDFSFRYSMDPNFIYIPRKLLLATKELSDYAGNQFIELYKDYLL